MWIRDFRERMGLELDELAKAVNMYRRFTKQRINGVVSDVLIHTLEVDDKAITHPVLANAIAVVCGATREERNSIVAEHNRCETWICPADSETEKLIRRAIYTATGRLPEDEPKRNEVSPQKLAAQFKKRPVVKLNRMGNTLESYDSVLDAANLNGLSNKYVRNRCRRTIKDQRFMFAGDRGYTFRYADEWDAMSQAERLADINAR